MLNSLQHIQDWLEQTIIGLNLCPFAQRPYEQGRIHLEISHCHDDQQAYLDFIQELQRLNTDKNISTTLLAFDQWEVDFLDFNDFLGVLENALTDHNLHKIYQLVAFHPNFQFDSVPSDDLANLVNRSPYPLIHILYHKDVANAAQSITSAENLSFINEQKLKSLSKDELKKHYWFIKNLRV